jgi:hypothetical protein
LITNLKIETHFITNKSLCGTVMGLWPDVLICHKEDRISMIGWKNLSYNIPCFVNYKKGCTRLAAASDKVYQLLAYGRWFSLGIPASSTTKNWSP